MIFQCFPLQCSPFSNSGILRSVSRTPYHLLPATLGLRAKVSTLGGASCSQQESSSASIPQKALQTLKCLKTLSRKSINWPKKQEHLYIYIYCMYCVYSIYSVYGVDTIQGFAWADPVSLTTAPLASRGPASIGNGKSWNEIDLTQPATGC